MVSRLRSDLLSAWRGVVAGRAASVIAVVVLALGTGVSITASAVAYGGMLRPLPFPSDSQLYTLSRIYAPTSAGSGIPLADFDRWREGLASSLEVSAYASERATLRGAGSPSEVRVAYVAGDWFQMLGMPARFGRLIDDRSNVDEAVVSSAFADRMSPEGPAAILNRVFTIGTRPIRVAGVLPPAFKVVSDADVWMLARGAAALRIAGARDTRSYRMVARLVDGQSENAARAHAIAALPNLVPGDQRDTWRVELTPLRSTILGDSRAALLTFLAASLLVLLVACANVAMLLVNRAIARTREFAVRVALGASRARIVSIAVMETAILAVGGSLAGWWLARIANTYLQQTTALTLPANAALGVETPILIAAAGAAAFVLLVCTVAPLLALRRAATTTALRTATTAGSRGGRQMRGALVVLQLALTVVLLTTAVLLGRTLATVSRADMGLDAPEAVLTMNLPIGESTADETARLATVRRVLEETRRLPGVVAAGIGGALPPHAGNIVFTITVSNAEDVDATRAFDFVPVTDGYFEALGARVRDGRLFGPEDDVNGDAICVMSEAAVNHLALVLDTAIGRPLNLSLPTASGEGVKPRIAGIIENIRYSGLDAPAHGAVYVPWRQLPARSAYLIVRTTTDPVSLSGALTRIVRDADPSMPLAPPRTLEEVVDEVVAPRAARFGLLSVFAGGATLLGLVGLSGALVRSVVERQRELAIRAAIGASPRHLLAGVIRDGLILAVTGVVIGLGLSALLARAVSAMITGVGPRDPLTYASTAVSVLIVALAACYLPARRAASTNPVVLLRGD